MYPWAVGLIIGGAVGNIIDRLLHDPGWFPGAVIEDFIDVQWWPIFNVAGHRRHDGWRAVDPQHVAAPAPTAAPLTVSVAAKRGMIGEPVPARRSPASASTGWSPCSPTSSRSMAAATVVAGGVPLTASR